MRLRRMGILALAVLICCLFLAPTAQAGLNCVEITYSNPNNLDYTVDHRVYAWVPKTSLVTYYSQKVGVTRWIGYCHGNSGVGYEDIPFSQEYLASHIIVTDPTTEQQKYYSQTVPIREGETVTVEIRLPY